MGLEATEYQVSCGQTHIWLSRLLNRNMTIQFGTSDWRPVIADEFTFAGVRSLGELINENKIVIGGEGSAGLSIKGHYSEKDGILACLLAAEAVAARGASLTEQLKDLYDRVGKLESGRIGIRLTPALMQSLGDKLKEDPGEFGGRRVERTNRLDGVKFIFADGSWLLMRPSGQNQ